MLKYGRRHCTQGDILRDGTWEGGVWYYDGQRVYYQIADYTKDPFWETCAAYVQQVYRDQYVLATDGKVLGWRIFPHGLYEHFIRTRDARSRDAIVLMSQNAAFASALTPLASVIDPSLSRETAYNIMLYMLADALGAPRHPNLDPYVDIALGHIDQWAISQNAPFVQPFMVALTAEALIQHQAKTGDPRVLPAIRVAMDWIWEHTWMPSGRAFRYIDRVVQNEGTPEPAPDLNSLIAPAYAWLYWRTGDPVYQQRADLIFVGGVQRAWLDGGKQFSQHYRWSFDYVRWRGGF